MINLILRIIIIAFALYFIITEYNDCKECFTNYLGVATKCFDCEKQFPLDQKWKAQPSKCFSCERELALRYGNEAAYQGKQQKCLHC
tara:strand:+ start:144 stop:404 length:261 start_codon:yes stop_codon:yes gene_type:complete